LIAAVIEQSPQEFGLRSAAWTAPVLCQYLRHMHGIEVSRKTVGRALDRLDLRWKRPRHQLALRPDTWRQSKGGSNAASGAARSSCRSAVRGRRAAGHRRLAGHVGLGQLVHKGFLGKPCRQRGHREPRGHLGRRGLTVASQRFLLPPG